VVLVADPRTRGAIDRFGLEKRFDSVTLLEWMTHEQFPALASR